MWCQAFSTYHLPYAWSIFYKRDHFDQKGPKSQFSDFSRQNFSRHFFKPKNLGSMAKTSKNLWTDLKKLVKMTIFGPKWPFLDPFWPKTAKTRFFRQNLKMSLPSHSEATTLCKKSEQSYERIFRSRKHGRTHEHTDGHTNGSETIDPQRR